MELTQEELDRANEILAQEVPYCKPQPVRPSLFHMACLLAYFAITRGRSARMIAREYGPNEKPDPAFQLRLLWDYTVNLKAENLRLSR